MSLYDDLDTDKKSDNVSGWASGIKFLQNHMQLKKATTTLPKRDQSRKTASLAPVVDFKKSKFGSMKDEDDDTPNTGPSFILPYQLPTIVKDPKTPKFKTLSAYLSKDPQWQFDNEYDPLYPNDYDKALKELRDRRDKEAEEEEKKRKDDDVKEEDDYFPSPSAKSTSGGVAIAPPSFYNQDSEAPEPPASSGPKFGLGTGGTGANFAARIMAKYGYKEGQGLGKKEQGMATALQVEKTSHRTGRIIQEKDEPKGIFFEIGGLTSTPPLASLASQYNDDEDIIEPETVEAMKAEPSKVVLLQNMVSPADVDDDLEPEVKEECQKYGEVLTVTVFQMPDMDGDDAIRIFVEFTTTIAAGKALADLDGRFFGGRQVKANYYDYEKFQNLDLTA